MAKANETTGTGGTDEDRVCAWLTALTWELAQAKDAHAELRRELRILKHDLWLARTGQRTGRGRGVKHVKRIKRIKRHAS